MAFDPIADEVFRHLFASIAEEMGVTLERTAYSPNIKERRDHSCAVFDAAGRLVAQAAHIPVHLGAFPMLMERLAPRLTWRRGDVVICNDPYEGGTHLPDVSIISPVFTSGGRRVGFVANRAHHADIGGSFPGSMAPAAEIYQEGVIIPPLKLIESGKLNEALLALFCRNVRTPDERRGDLEAQLAANATGVRRFGELLARYGAGEISRRIRTARQHTRRTVQALLRDFPSGPFPFTDYLEGPGVGTAPLPICVSVRFTGGMLCADFTGTAQQQTGSINATLAVTHAAVYYALMCVLGERVTPNHGLFECVRVDAPLGSLVNAAPPAPVAAGNVETSQRMVDALFGALAQALPDRVPAASQGTMNNLTLGGLDPTTGKPWAYYETTGGGAGASPLGPGISGVHCHMSNTRNTPAEALEFHYPLRVTEYSLRPDSGGAGTHAGGAGVRREIELLAPASAALMTERRERGPYGLQGGEAGTPGRNSLSGAPGAAWEVLPGKGKLQIAAGSRLRVETPGGGGWGEPDAGEPYAALAGRGGTETPEQPARADEIRPIRPG